MEFGYRHGDSVEVVRGKKFPHGLKGKAFWAGEGKFGGRVGVELEGGEKIFIDLKNLKNADREAREEAEYAEKKAEHEAKMAAVEKAEALFSKPVYGKEHMGAYGGSWEVTVDILDPSKTDAELEAALHLVYPHQSSYAALRWSTGISYIKVHREAGLIAFNLGYGMCD
jgi:hypothetical protein